MSKRNINYKVTGIKSITAPKVIKKINLQAEQVREIESVSNPSSNLSPREANRKIVSCIESWKEEYFANKENERQLTLSFLKG